ncbi:hypothetical protein BGZ60DRAFT_534148 [Tricladium varicosporioides]|nr:hypothetical protein BGZ60DRAFT_534148 [Hymenoscyphus varicosporioides]
MGGEPLESESWNHGAEKAKKAAGEIWDQAASERGKMGYDYIGYDSKEGFKGHDQRVKNCRGFAKKHHDAASRHNNYFSN